MREPNTELCRRMLSPHNLEVAVQNVKRNKGSAGVDGMEVDGIDGCMEDNWTRIEEQILARTYKPKPVKRVEIPRCQATWSAMCDRQGDTAGDGAGSSAVFRTDIF